MTHPSTIRRRLTLRRLFRAYLVNGLATFCIVVSGQTALSEEPSTAETFGHTILPILNGKCVSCHHDGDAEGDLNLSTFQGVVIGGATGPALQTGAPEQSYLIERIRKGEMPPEGEEALTPAELATIEDWIRRATLPNPESIAQQRAVNIHKRADQLWSFQPLRKPTPPNVRDKHRSFTAIDRFILSTLESQNASLSAEADRRTLLRRITFNLTGLPPTPDEIDDFLLDRSPSAWDKVINRLLASPHYGERWGRHWLDVAGWAESSLLIGDFVHPGFWRYRDWVIQAFNDDMPYDQFVREQLSGDEMVSWRTADQFDQNIVDKLTATGFLRCTPDGTDNQPITQEEKIFATQQTAVEVVTKALLGLTLNCVRCHDHKYDPVTQREYYELVAIFQPAYDPKQWIPGMVNSFGAGPSRMIPIASRQERIRFDDRMKDFKRHNDEFVYQKEVGIPNRYRDMHIEQHADKLPDTIDRQVLFSALQIEERQRSDSQKTIVFEAAKYLDLGFEQLKKLYPQLKDDQSLNNQQHKALREEGQQVGDVIWALWDVSVDPSPTHLLNRGEFRQPAEVVDPGVLATLRSDLWDQCVAKATENVDTRVTTGRRTAFANWVTHPEHPLTARVMVNRIWQYHFGTGLVSTPDDFGARGAKPSHPELLDWLATEFVDSGWSIKHLHRLILQSAVYRQASGHSETEPALLASFPRRRLEAEPIRDAALSVAGKLDLTFYGESIKTVVSSDGSAAAPDHDPGRYRRSIYLSTRRTQLPTFLAVFDAPSMDTNWPRRHDSAIASQSLALMNHPQFIECAESFARCVGDEVGEQKQSDALRIQRMFVWAYGRLPESNELALFLSELQSVSPEEHAALWVTFAHAILASSEFFYID